MHKKPFVIGLTIVVVVGATVLLILNRTSEPKNPSGSNHGCTLEAKICPDGSAVGRGGPNCEFEECPDTQPIKP